jgi:hypothetical protein
VSYILDEFERYAIWYKQKHGKSPTLVIDDVNQIANSEPKLLQYLQGRASTAAKQNLYSLVFVTSDSSVPLQMIGMKITK